MTTDICEDKEIGVNDVGVSSLIAGNHEYSLRGRPAPGQSLSTYSSYQGITPNALTAIDMLERQVALVESRDQRNAENAARIAKQEQEMAESNTDLALQLSGRDVNRSLATPIQKHYFKEVLSEQDTKSAAYVKARYSKWPLALIIISWIIGLLLLLFFVVTWIQHVYHDLKFFNSAEPHEIFGEHKILGLIAYCVIFCLLLGGFIWLSVKVVP